MSDKLRAAAQAALEWLKDKRLDTWAYMEGSQFYSDRHKQAKALDAALAEPEQEPVACIKTNGELMWLKKPSTIYSKPRPLYTAPPRREWVGLTQTQVKLLREGVHEESIKTGDSIDWVFYTHINESLKEKNT